MAVKKKYIIFVLLIVTIFGGCFFYKNRKEIYINKILSEEAYSYLPLQAKEYIKEIHEKTGKIVLTEKNKKENTLYLNPRYIDYITYSEEKKKKVAEIPIPMIVDYSIKKNQEGIVVPTSYDLRNDNGNNYVTPVRNQGDLGICWTFATAGAVESHILKKSNTTYTSSSKLISERQLDYATSRNGISDYNSEYISFLDRVLGDGGNFYISTIAMANGISLINYNSFKAYNDSDLSKIELSDTLNYDNSLYEVDSTINFPNMSYRESTSTLTEEEKNIRTNFINEVKKKIVENGASYLSTSLGSNSSCTYVDSKLNNLVIDDYNCTSVGGHAMEIIGWDDNIEYSYCSDTAKHNSNITNCRNIISGKGVWILKNSWGESNPYPYLTYDSLNTGINFIEEIENSENRNWDNNYIFEEGIDDDLYVKEKTYQLLDTKIKDDEYIKKIKFITLTPYKTYIVKIINKDGSFKIYSKEKDLPGLITIDIANDIIVNKDSKILISSDGEFVDRLSIFTSNINKTSYINMTTYENKNFTEEKVRLYAETKNVQSGTILQYKLYNSSNEDISTNLIVSNNIVAENNINTLVDFTNISYTGNYRLDIIYNSNVISTTNIIITKMNGTGTKEDPYIITNSDQLNQIRNDLDAYYELANDIDLSTDTLPGGKLSVESSTCPQGFGWEEINGFSGSLDGKGHSIKGLHQKKLISCSDYTEWKNTNSGLFGTTFGNVEIKNLILDNFDITCKRKYCSALIADYNSNNNSDDTTEYNAIFKNIALKNSKLEGYNYDKYYFTMGGLFGEIVSNYGNVLLSNIYLDLNLESQYSLNASYFIYSLSAKNATINNIQLQGNFAGNLKNSILINTLYVRDKVEINNILSTVKGTNIEGQLFEEIWGNANNLSINGINTLKIPNKTLAHRFDDINDATITNTNFYDFNTKISEFVKLSNYSSWKDFDSNWIIRTIDGIPRIPVLNFIDFEYTNIPDITLNQKLNEKINIYDLITPNIKSAKNIIYKSNDENIVEIDSNGILIPKSSGNTTIHVESSYDGYIKNVPISVTYIPHYNVILNANGGIETMNSIEVSVENNYTLPENTFTKEHYIFNGWNTLPDGTGDSYSNLAQINSLNDKETITLYAQWIGEDYIINFDANGGKVNLNKKIVHYGEKYGDLPVPVKDGYGFVGWSSGGAIIDSLSDLSAKDLVANWRSGAYTILFYANSGLLKNGYISPYSDLKIMSNSLATSYALNDQNKTLFNNMYVKEGYKFKEWNTSSDGIGVSYKENQIINLKNVNNSQLKLYAIWEKETAVITFNSNEENAKTFTQNFTLNTDTKLSKNTFTKTGYKFTNWNTLSDNTGISYNDEALINISKNIILYAIWQETFDYSINDYVVDNTNKYINKIRVGTSVNEFKKNIQLNTDYNVEIDYKIINNKNVLFTGGITKIYKDNSIYTQYTNVVMGDINGDGATNSADLLKIRQHLLGISTLKGAYYQSSDINEDNLLNSADLLRIRQHLLGTKPIM